MKKTEPTLKACPVCGVIHSPFCCLLCGQQRRAEWIGPMFFISCCECGYDIARETEGDALAVANRRAPAYLPPRLREIVKELREAEAKATEGPWERELAQDGEWTRPADNPPGYAGEMYETNHVISRNSETGETTPIAEYFNSGNDADLIYKVRNLLPELVAILETMGADDED